MSTWASALLAGYLILQIHIQIVHYSFLFHCNNGCTNAPQCYIIRPLSLVYYCNVTYTIVIFHCLILSILRPGPNEKAGQPGSCPRAQTYKEHGNVSEITGNMLLGNSGFHARKCFFKKFSHFGHALSRMFLRSVIDKKVERLWVWVGAPNH
jgi:hypothetical protein